MKSRIEGTIEADQIEIGHGVYVEPDVVISGKGGPAKRVVLGDFCYIGRGTRIYCPEFTLGDYSKLNALSYGHGEKPLRIGRNCWFGGSVVLDSMGGLDIEDNVGVGAHSQLWTHIQFGDIVEGCRFHSRKYMRIGQDAWLVGHCILSPVRVGARSMAMVGSVITKDMLENHIYAGVPAQDMTAKMGTQFEDRTLDQKAAKLEELIATFTAAHPQHRGRYHVARDRADRPPDVTTFDVSTRTYTKTRSVAEVAFLKAHVPLIKFAPEGEAPWVPPAEPDPGAG